MTKYKPKFEYDVRIADMNFALQVAGLSDKRYDSVPEIEVLRNKEELSMTIQAAADFAKKTLWPLYNNGEHATFKDKVVTLPEGYEQACKEYKELGFHGLSADKQDGGMSYPGAYDAICTSIFMGANNPYQLRNGLSKSAYLGLKRNAHDAEPGNPEHKLTSGLRNILMEKLATSEIPGIMVMTEGDYGTYLKDVKALVRPSEDQKRLLMDSSKIYITSGDDNFSDNIVHVVLARFKGDDKPSLFMVTRNVVNEKGEVDKDRKFPENEKHSVYVGDIENKMGLEQSATTKMFYENAECYLIGERGHGQSAMFVLMNEARRMIGRQALGIAEAAFQQSFKNSIDYAGSGRVQGFAYNGKENNGNKMDPIASFGQVREMILRQRSFVEGGNVLDKMTELENELKGKDSKAWVDLMTYAQKYHFTEQGNKSVDQAIQTFGGEGYIKEFGVERLLRDIRVTRIYEGSNQIQAFSLTKDAFTVQKGDNKRKLDHVVERITNFLDQYKDEKYTKVLSHAVEMLQKNADHIYSEYKKSNFNKDVIDAYAKNFTELFSEVSMGYIWAKTAQISQEALKDKNINSEDKLFYETKLATAYFHMNVVLDEKINPGKIKSHSEMLTLLEIPDAMIMRHDVAMEYQAALNDISKSGLPKDIDKEKVAKARVTRCNQPLENLSESEKRDVYRTLEELKKDMGEERRQDPFSKLVVNKLDALQRMKGINKGSALAECLEREKSMAVLN